MDNKKIIILVVLLVFAGIVGIWATSGVEKSPTLGEGVEETISKKVTLHKSPNCGCCGVYGTYLKKLDYDVDVHDTNDMMQVKMDLGVPMELESCHTLEVGGYVVEGHIPEEAIRELLSLRPDIGGIGMPGMPSGSPGMPGPKSGDFVIYEITKEGEVGDIFLTI